jgi:hypothetical protein
MRRTTKKRWRLIAWVNANRWSALIETLCLAVATITLCLYLQDRHSKAEPEKAPIEKQASEVLDWTP